MVRYEPVTLLLEEGDIITSKKGILMPETPITKKSFVVFKLKYMGNGILEVLGNKKIEVELIKKEKKEDKKEKKEAKNERRN